MKTKKIIIFVLCAVLPMICIGMLVHAIDTPIVTVALSSLAMMLPLLAVVITRLVCKEPVLKGLGLSIKI